MIKITQQAQVDGYTFAVHPDHFSITREGKEMVVLSPEDATEVVAWLAALILMGPQPSPKAKDIPPTKLEKSDFKIPSTDDLATRKAVTKAPLSLGMADPHSAPDSSPDGLQRIHGVETVDLVVEAKRAGVPLRS